MNSLTAFPKYPAVKRGIQTVTVSNVPNCFSDERNSGLVRLMKGTSFVEVVGLAEFMSIRTIIQRDKFCTYDESDLFWAEPLGLCTVVHHLIDVGDSAKLSNFIDGPEVEMNLKCIKSNYDLGGRYPKSELVFVCVEGN